MGLSTLRRGPLCTGWRDGFLGTLAPVSKAPGGGSGMPEDGMVAEEEFKNFAVVIASAFAALVLAVAAFIASHPRRPDREE